VGLDGGLFDALVSWPGITACPWSAICAEGETFEPQAAMQLMADHAVRNVFLPPTALNG